MIFFWIRLKNASSVAFWLAGTLVVTLILSLGVLFSVPGGLSIQVGIYGNAPLLLASDDWTLVQYYNLEQMRQDVANRRLELGYAFNENMITLYTSPATVTDNVTNLLVAAANLEANAGEIGARSLGFFMEADATDIQARTEGFLAEGPLMERVVVMYGWDGQENIIANAPYRRLFHGLIALFAQLIAMLCAMNYANKNEMAVLSRLKAVGIGKWWLYILAGIGSIVALTGAIMAVTVILAGWMFPGVWVLQDAPIGVIYLLVISALAVFWAMILPKGVYPPFLILAFVFTVLMGGVIFDLSEVLETVSFLRLLFPSHYYIAILLSVS